MNDRYKLVKILAYNYANKIPRKGKNENLRPRLSVEMRYNVQRYT